LSGPAATLPVGTRLRVVDQPYQVTAEGDTMVQVEGIDDPSIGGFMVATDLAPRDSSAPIVRALEPGGPFSPNGDGQVDSTTISGRFTEAVAWTLRVRNAADDILFEKTGSGATFSVAWDGLVGGAPVPDGTYTVSVSGVDSWDNAPATTSRSLKVDTEAPTLEALSPGADTAQWFSPNGDGVRDTVTVTATNAETGTLLARVLDADGALVKKWSVPNASAAEALTWTGKNTAGDYVADGVYTIRVAPQDVAGNVGEGVDRTVKVVAALRTVATTRTIFFPQDSDALAKSTTLSFTLARPMTVTWTIRNAAGETVNTHLTDAALPAGTQAWKFTGLTTDGAMLPRGQYTSHVTATDGTLSAAQAVAFDLNAFRLKLSDTTPGRGQSITINVASAETLAKRPTLFVYQPGVARWAVLLTKTGTYTYKATIRMKSSGKAGTLSLKVKGYDTKGGSQSTTVTYKIH
jgi:flagellar hook assembly protein FlgD